MKKMIWIAVLLTVAAATLPAQGKRAMRFDDMISMKRLDAVSASSDGRWLVYNIRTYSLSTNTYQSNIYLQSVDGKTIKPLTTSSKKDLNPVFSPDGRQIAFVSNRSGSFQIYTMYIDGGEPVRVTNLSTGVSPGRIEWSSDGKYILFTTDVYADCADDDCNRMRNEERENSKVKAQIFERLPYRVWDSWKEGKRSQLFLAEAATGKTTDLIRGDYDIPPIDLGGSQDYTFSPDAQSVAFTMNTEPNIAWSTNNDIFLMTLPDGEPRKISESPGNDNQPVFSPDGKYIAYNSMKRAGYEADKRDIIIYEIATGKRTNLTEKFDRSAGHVAWSANSRMIYFDTDDLGYHSIYQIPVTGGVPTKVSADKKFDQLELVTPGKIIFKRTSVQVPHELWAMNPDGSDALQLTQLNTAILSGLDIQPAEEFWFEGAAKARVQGFLIKPPGFNEKKKYSMVYLVHGGPQGVFADMWHWRWNAALFAAPGHVVVMVNPRGSVGYGQKFTDDINLDWGGRAFEDLMKGVDYVLANYKFIDKNRIGAAGASYGGYMMNWFNGHTDRFKCIITHSGIMNKINMYGATEELWFEEWEMGGPYWEKKHKETYEKWSPHNYVQNFKTPTLVIHGELDFRVPVTEGIHLFTVLQRKGIPSKFIYFPDEGHLILKPQNVRLWYKEVHAWLEHYLIPYEK